MEKKAGRYELYGNPITPAQSRAADHWQAMLARKFKYDPNEEFNLSVHDNPYGWKIFGLKDILRDDSGNRHCNTLAEIYREKGGSG